MSSSEKRRLGVNHLLWVQAKPRAPPRFAIPCSVFPIATSTSSLVISLGSHLPLTASVSTRTQMQRLNRLNNTMNPLTCCTKHFDAQRCTSVLIFVLTRSMPRLESQNRSSTHYATPFRFPQSCPYNKSYCPEFRMIVPASM